MTLIYPLQLRKDNERIQSALQDAVNIRMAKEGEVSVLRKNIEKVIFWAIVFNAVSNIHLCCRRLRNIQGI